MCQFDSKTERAIASKFWEHGTRVIHIYVVRGHIDIEYNTCNLKINLR